MSIRDELLAIQQADPGNVLYPPAVVAWARANVGSALHAAIEWDDERAADAHRLWQIRRLIQLHITAEDGSPQMVSLSIDRAANGGYRSVSDVVKAPDLRQIMLDDALAELERVQIKYNRVTALERVWKEADSVRQQARGRRRVREPA